MRCPSSALLALTVLAVALVSGTVDFHPPTHVDPRQVLAVAVVAMPAVESAYIEAAGDAGDLLCPACLVLLQSVASPRPEPGHSTAPEGEMLRREPGDAPPLSIATGTASSRAPPQSPA